MTDPVPETPKAPRPILFYVAAAVLGCCAGICIGLVISKSTPEIIEREVPRDVPCHEPCHECAEAEAAEIAAASAESARGGGLDAAEMQPGPGMRPSLNTPPLTVAEQLAGTKVDL